MAKFYLFILLLIGGGIVIHLNHSHLPRSSFKSVSARTQSLTPRPHLSPRQTSTQRIQETQEKLEILSEIFQSKNDNDPRLDQEFNHLSDETKDALEQKYDSIHPESRNQKGTIAFLIGRNLTSSRDLEFLRHVIKEAPCLSLNHCSKPDLDQKSEHSATQEVTLEYPQIVALKALESHLKQKPDSPLALEILNEATQADGPLARCPLARQMASAYIEKHQ